MSASTKGGGGGPSGRLVLVGTPIGNLDDISPRAVKALAAADVIFCEDTRRARKLLSALGVPAPRLVRLDRHNEDHAAESVLDAVTDGSIAVLVTDAGMPTVSDPGSGVVARLSGEGLPVEVVPGPTAVSAALALSGLPASRYRFVGFLDRKGRARSEQIASLAAEKETAVIYESPHRVARTVADLQAACGAERQFVAAREMTKLHEEVWRGTLGEAAEWLAGFGDRLLGEWVLVLGGSPEGPVRPDASAASAGEIEAALRARIAAGSSKKDAVAAVSNELGVARRQVYEISVAIPRASSDRGSGS
jgi:16S rRNA (cytidine1402-2'-O)-methyltransferase